MSNPKNSIADKLNTAQVAISNSLADPEIQALVAAYGYPAEKLNAGKALLDEAIQAVSSQQAAAGAQLGASRELDESKRAAQDAYQALAKITRAVYKNDRPRLVALGLTGIMPETTGGFIAAASMLFANAGGLPALADYGYDAARLASERARITAYDQANNRQEAAKGDAQQATREQNAAIECIDEWTAQYIKIARVALREKAQLLEKLGILARTSKTAAQRAAPAKVAATRKTGQS